MRSRAWPISRKEKIATAAPTRARPLIPRKANNRRFATPSRDGTHIRRFGLGNAVDRLDLARLMSAPWPQGAKRRRPPPSSAKRIRQRASIEKRAVRNVAPANGGLAEIYKALVDPP